MGWLHTIGIVLASPWHLVWLVAIAIPIAIALWRRRHLESVPWASNFLLKRLLEKQSRLSKWKQWLLLCARICFLVTLAFAAASPSTSPSNFAPTLPPTLDTIVIVIDTSFSMEQKSASGDRLTFAKEKAKEIIRKANSNAQFIIVDGSTLLSSIGNSQLLDAPNAIDRINGLASKPNASRILRNLTSTVRQIDSKTSAPSAIHVHIISDFDESTIQSLDVNELANLRRQFRNIESLEITSIRPLNENSNLVVQSIEFESALVLKNKDLVVTAAIEHRSGQSPVNSRATLFADGIAVNSQAINFQPGETTRIDFDWTPKAVGDVELNIRIEDNAIQTDNRLYSIANVKSMFQITIVSDSETESKFLRLATSVSSDRGTVEVVAIERRDLNRNSISDMLQKTDCLMMIDLKSSDIEWVSQYLNSGGNALFFCGSKTKPSTVSNLQKTLENNTTGKKDGAVLSNWPRFSAPSPIGQFEIAGSKNTEDLTLPPTPIFRFWELENGNAIKPLLSLASGDAIALSSVQNWIDADGNKVPSAKIIWVLTSATMDSQQSENDWNALPIWPTFVPFIHDAIRNLANSSEPRTFQIGQRVDVALQTQRFQVRHPSGKVEDWIGEKQTRRAGHPLSRHTVSLKESNQTTTPFHSEITFYAPGVYRLESSPKNGESALQALIAVNPDPNESTTSNPSLASLNSWIESNRKNPVEAPTIESRERTILTLQSWLARVCIGLAILLLACESLISVSNKS